MATKQERPTLVIFSSSKLVRIAEAMRDNLSYPRADEVSFEVTPWTEGFFRSNEVPLNTFLKNLLRFDAERLRVLIERHLLYTGSARARELLDDWDQTLASFVKVMPLDFRRALLELRAERQAAKAAAAE